MSSSIDYATSSSGGQARVNSANNTILIDGSWVPQDSPLAKQRGYGFQASPAATQYANAQNAAEVAQLDQQEVEDRISENKSRNAGITALAFGNAQRGPQMGRGLFQRRQAGTKIGAALGSLSSANAGKLKDARMKTLRAKQAADITRTNPVLGYQAAIAGLQRQMG